VLKQKIIEIKESTKAEGRFRVIGFSILDWEGRVERIKGLSGWVEAGSRARGGAK
jgi:predicted aldo/keto reductase-like oxidoreductase